MFRMIFFFVLNMMCFSLCFADNINVCDGITGQAFRPDLLECSRYHFCTPRREWTLQCPVGEVWNQEKNTCVGRGTSDDTCTIHGLHLYKERFTQELKQLEIPLHAKATVRKPAMDRWSSNFFCPSGAIGRHAHPTRCAQFFDCSKTAFIDWWGRSLRECPFPSVYDNTTKGCSSPSKAKCNNRAEPVDECDYLKNQCRSGHCVPCSIRHPECIGVPDGIYSKGNKERTPHFIVCRNSQIKFRGRCEEFGKDLYFNQTMKACVSVNDTQGAHIQIKSFKNVTIDGSFTVTKDNGTMLETKHENASLGLEVSTITEEIRTSTVEPKTTITVQSLITEQRPNNIFFGQPLKTFRPMRLNTEPIGRVKMRIPQPFIPKKKNVKLGNRLLQFPKINIMNLNAKKKRVKLVSFPLKIETDHNARTINTNANERYTTNQETPNSNFMMVKNINPAMLRANTFLQSKSSSSPINVNKKEANANILPKWNRNPIITENRPEGQTNHLETFSQTTKKPYHNILQNQWSRFMNNKGIHSPLVLVKQENRVMNLKDTNGLTVGVPHMKLDQTTMATKPTARNHNTEHRQIGFKNSPNLLKIHSTNVKEIPTDALRFEQTGNKPLEPTIVPISISGLNKPSKHNLNVLSLKQESLGSSLYVSNDINSNIQYKDSNFKVKQIQNTEPAIGENFIFEEATIIFTTSAPEIPTLTHKLYKKTADSSATSSKSNVHDKIPNAKHENNKEQLSTRFVDRPNNLQMQIPREMYQNYGKALANDHLNVKDVPNNTERLSNKQEGGSVLRNSNVNIDPKSVDRSTRNYATPTTGVTSARIFGKLEHVPTKVEKDFNDQPISQNHMKNQSQNEKVFHGTLQNDSKASMFVNEMAKGSIHNFVKGWQHIENNFEKEETNIWKNPQKINSNFNLASVPIEQKPRQLLLGIEETSGKSISNMPTLRTLNNRSLTHLEGEIPFASQKETVGLDSTTNKTSHSKFISNNFNFNNNSQSGFEIGTNRLADIQNHFRSIQNIHMAMEHDTKPASNKSLEELPGSKSKANEVITLNGIVAADQSVVPLDNGMQVPKSEMITTKSWPQSFLLNDYANVQNHFNLNLEASKQSFSGVVRDQYVLNKDVKGTTHTLEGLFIPSFDMESTTHNPKATGSKKVENASLMLVDDLTSISPLHMNVPDISNIDEQKSKPNAAKMSVHEPTAVPDYYGQFMQVTNQIHTDGTRKISNHQMNNVTSGQVRQTPRVPQPQPEVRPNGNKSNTTNETNNANNNSSYDHVVFFDVISDGVKNGQQQNSQIFTESPPSQDIGVTYPTTVMNNPYLELIKRMNYLKRTKQFRRQQF